MEAIPEKLTVRLGGLRQPLEAWCDESGLTPSAAVRKAIAEMLEAPEPLMNDNVKNLRQFHEMRCKHCGQRTMHTGDVCYGCNQRRDSL